MARAMCTRVASLLTKDEPVSCSGRHSSRWVEAPQQHATKHSSKADTHRLYSHKRICDTMSATPPNTGINSIAIHFVSYPRLGMEHSGAG